MRGDLSGEPGFTTYLARVRQVALEPMRTAICHFEKLVERLAPSRNLLTESALPGVFRLGNTPSMGLQLRGLAEQRVEGVSRETASSTCRSP